MALKIQRGLRKLDYKPSEADGVLREETRKAIMLFQTDQGLLVNATPAQRLLDQIFEKILEK